MEIASPDNSSTYIRLMCSDGANYLCHEADKHFGPIGYALQLIRNYKPSELGEPMLQISQLVCPGAETEREEEQGDTFLYGAFIGLELALTYLPEHIQDRLRGNLIRIKEIALEGTSHIYGEHERSLQIKNSILQVGIDRGAKKYITADLEDLVVTWGFQTNENQPLRDKYFMAGFGFVLALTAEADNWANSGNYQMQIYEDQGRAYLADEVESWLSDNTTNTNN